ncbi:MAG: S9 family peptidase [Flavobacteriales bacterium]|nr:S9 family peptidase [Flavobacteriales bacterium]
MSKNTLPPICEIKNKDLTIHEHVRTDPYYWLNDRENPEVIDYLNKENEFTDNVLSPTKEFQKSLFKELKGRIKEEDESIPYIYNGYEYWRKFSKGDEHAVHLRKKTGTDSNEILLNGNELAKGFDYFDLGDFDVSPNNEILAYSTDTLSRRIYNIHFRNLSTNKVLDETIENTTGSMAWANDNKTVFYTKQDEQTLRSFQIYRHTIGTDPKNDTLIFEEKDETFYCYVYKSKSEKYIIINSSSTLSDEYSIIDADQPNQKLKIFQPRKRGLEYSIFHHQDEFLILTNKDHPNFSLMSCKVQSTDTSHWKTLLNGRDDVLLEDIELFTNHYVLSERSNGLMKLKISSYREDKFHYIEFDEPTYVIQSAINPEMNTNQLRFGYSSLVNSGSIYQYDMDSKERKLLKQKEVVGGYDASQYESKRLWTKSRDGVNIPMSMVYKKGIELDGNNPLLLYAYGSYGYSIDPYFSPNRLSLLNRGFVFVIAHIRGGEEMGRSWYEDGKLLKKKNTFNDFIDCANYLISEQYTSSEHIYAAGGSAGGLLMGAVLNMESTLFNGMLAQVPFVDVVTTMLDESIPLTTGEYDEWGNPNNKEYYDYILSYSPYDNVEKKEYTNLLVTTGLHDSQVQYWEPAKWVAKLRDYKTDDNILLLHTNMKAGHGGSSGRFEYLKEIALEYAFIMHLEGLSK